ncbi:MAG: GTPase Era [Rickettsiales bacterium]|nr:GTPase Era [Rickettsiales bacterium]
MQNNKKFGYVVIVGSPNTGKSTLTNAIVGSKVTIVSPKAQTTRSRVTGIKIVENTQIVLIDTPGIFNLAGNLNNKLNRSIVATAKNSLENADVICFMIDVTKGLRKNEEIVLKELEKHKSPKILVLNKIDLINKTKLFEIAKNISEKADFQKVFMISASKNDGVLELEKYLATSLPSGDWQFPEDEISTIQTQFLCAEITREKLFNALQEELPYGLYVENEKFEESEKSIKIHQAIITNSEMHKKIIVGKAGSMIKKIGEESRKDIENILGKKTHLFLFVKVTEGWQNKNQAYISSQIDLAK